MPEIKIPFLQEFEEPLLNGQKTMTSRNKRYGKGGDVFEAFGGIFRILDVTKMQLDEVAERWYQEGFSSKEEFIECWNKIHPIKRYDAEQWVWVHIFEREE